MKPKVLFLLLIPSLMVVILTTRCSTYTKPVISQTPTMPITLVPSIFNISTYLPFNGKIAFINANGPGYYYHIYVMNANGSELKDISPKLPEISSLAWEPGGEHLAFDAVTEGRHQIFTMKVNGLDVKQLTFSDESSYNPSLSSDGKHIIFLSSQKNILDDRGEIAQQIYIMKSDGTEIKRLTNDHESVNAATYRSDDFISVSVPATPKNTRTYIINSEGVTQKQFPEFTIDGIPVWSPDNQHIVLTTIRATCSGLTIMKANGSDQVCLLISKLSTSQSSIGTASWSPDGKYIIFSSNLNGNWDIYAININGSDLIRLTNLPGDESAPIWLAEP